jgi:hypothetical protein
LEVDVADNFNTLYNRLLARCPSVGAQLSMQLINDSWHEIQSKREWSFRRRSSSFSPPDIYNTGYASTNVASGNPTLITGFGTSWTINMIGRQIRLGGYLFPFYTIIGWLSPTSILIDQPWYGPDVTLQAYTIVQIYYPVPVDFGYFYTIVSVKDGFRLWTNITEADLAMLDPQRTNFGQTYGVAFRGYAGQYGGVIGPAIPVTSPSDPGPISTTTMGYSYPVNATYIVQVVSGGISGTATWRWMRSGQTAFQLAIPTSNYPVDLADGVQVYWPDGRTYVANDLFVINCQSLVTASTVLYELWPGPTYSAYLYPYIYIAKEYDLSVQQPTLPPFMENRGEVILELALMKCAEYPGPDVDHLNIYHDLKQAAWHRAKFTDMMIDLERNDEEVGVTNIDFQVYPMAPAPWATGQWQQSHAPFLLG